MIAKMMNAAKSITKRHNRVMIDNEEGGEGEDGIGDEDNKKTHYWGHSPRFWS